jgi:hypothetical protein
MSEQVENKANYSIVRKIQALLNLGEAGKLDSFFGRIDKTLNKDIVGHKKNIEALEFELENKKDKLEDDLADAEQELESAYLDVPVEEISTNEDQKNYMKVYLGNVKKYQDKVEDIKKDIKKVKSEHKDEVDKINEEIKSLKEMIDVVTSK